MKTIVPQLVLGLVMLGADASYVYAQEPIPSVAVREYGNASDQEVWNTLVDIVPRREDVMLLGWLYGSPGGSVLWSEGEIILRSSDLVVLGHPLADQGVEARVAWIRRASGVAADGSLTLLARLTCDDCPLEDTDAVLRWMGGDSADYLFGSTDAMLLDGDLVTPIGISRVLDNRDGQAYALVSWLIADVPQYALVAATTDEPPRHVEPVLMRRTEVLNHDGSLLGRVHLCTVVNGVLPWTGLPLTGAEVLVDYVGLQRHALLGNRSISSAVEDSVVGLAIEGVGWTPSLTEGGRLLYAGTLVQEGDVTEENDAFIAFDDSIAAREGDPCPGLETWTFGGDETPSTPLLLSMDDYGNAAFTWRATDSAGEVHSVAYYNGQPLLAAGDLVDANNDGRIDDADGGAYFVRLGSDTPLVLRREALYLFAEVFLPQYGQRTALLRIAPLSDIPNAWDTRPPCVGDVDNDRDVDQSDLGLLLAAYESSYADAAYHPCADLDADGDVDQADLGLLLPNYETVCD
jgi:hypothetical protein